MPKTKVQNIKSDEEVVQLKNQLARALADYDNLRRRSEEEKKLWVRFASERILINLLPILDNLEAAQKHLKDQGLAIAISEFKKVLDEESLIEINPKKGEMFDPLLHEVVESVQGDSHGEIAETLIPGWKFKDGNVVRVAKVKVFQKTS